jgi:cytoskeletal protein RodZ
MFERNRIAETLRGAREKQGLSLEQAASAAGIPLQYVRLLEGEANVRVGVSDELYLIPFFRKYAHFVGINAEELLPEFLGVVQQLPGEGSPPIRLSYRSRWAALWRPAAVVLAIAIAVTLMLRQGPDRGDQELAVRQEDEPAVPLPSGAAASATAGPESNAALPLGVAVTPEAAASSGIPSATPSPTAVPEDRPTGAHQLRITATDEAWLSLAIDDQPGKQYLLKAGEARTWSAERAFSLTVGNAGGIAVALDGRDLPPLGPTGKVIRNLHLPADEAANRRTP